MKINCGRCGSQLKEGQEVYGRFAAFYHEIPSRIAFSVSKPHEMYADTLEHVTCPEEYQ